MTMKVSTVSLVIGKIQIRVVSQYDTTTHTPVWLKLKRRTIPTVEKDINQL